MKKVCPEGKIVNPKTGRCIKDKNIKTEKICPEGKVINPKTGRCIKIKPVNNTKNIRDPRKMTTNNQAIINQLKILQEYEKINKNPFKVNAYDKVIDGIEMYEKDIESAEDLKNIKGVGKKIEDKIIEFLTTGKMHAVENALKDEKYILGKKLLNIYGIGPAKVEELLEKIQSFDQLRLDENKALLNEKQKIGLKYYDDLEKRIPYSEGKKHYKIIEKTIGNHEITFDMVGSYRRKNKDMGDIDILIKDHPQFNLKEFVNVLTVSGYILETLASGKNKFMGICRIADDLPARRIDVLVTDPKTYHFALLYFTGSYTFNIYMRRIALQKGLSLSEYGFKDTKTNKLIDTSSVIQSEEDVFKYLDIPYVAPDKR